MVVLRPAQWGDVQESSNAHEVVVGRVGRSNCVQSDHTRRLHLSLIDIALPVKLLGRFLLQPGSRDQAVAPQTALARSDRSDDSEEVEQLAGRSINLGFSADLRASNQVLVSDGVEHQSGLHCVSSEEDVVAVHETASCGWLGDVAEDGVKSDTRM